MRISVYTVGGTIDKVYFDARSTYEVGAPEVTRLFARAKTTFEFAVTEIARKDSLELTPADREALRDRVSADACPLILVTNGTDTMTETARVLAGLPGKTIVLTGALEPARFIDSDAPFNLGMAVAALQTCAPGVYIVMNGHVFDAAKVRKNPVTNTFEPVP
jgi:L-asparaginase